MYFAKYFLKDADYDVEVDNGLRGQLVTYSKDAHFSETDHAPVSRTACFWSSCRTHRGGVQPFVVDGAEVVDRRVTPARVVPRLDALEDRRRQIFQQSPKTNYAAAVGVRRDGAHGFEWGRTAGGGCDPWCAWALLRTGGDYYFAFGFVAEWGGFAAVVEEGGVGGEDGV